MEYLAFEMDFVVKWKCYSNRVQRGCTESMYEGKDIFEGVFDPRLLFVWKNSLKGTKTEYHSHDYLQVAFVMSGNGKYRLDDKIYEVTEGDLLVLNPGTKHQPLPMEEQEVPCVVFHIAVSDFQLAGYAPNALPVEEGEFLLHTAGELMQKLLKICTSIDSEKAICKPGHYYMMKAYATQLLLLVIRERSQPVERIGGLNFEAVNKKYVVEKIIEYFETHYQEKISLDQIANNMYLSPFYISKIFKSETGETPIRHLIDIRLEKARELLLTGEYESIKEVAAKVGYEDAYHFSKLFKKRYGLSPSRIKNSND